MKIALCCWAAGIFSLRHSKSAVKLGETQLVCTHLYNSISQASASHATCKTFTACTIICLIFFSKLLWMFALFSLILDTSSNNHSEFRGLMLFLYYALKTHNPKKKPYMIIAIKKTFHLIKIKKIQCTTMKMSHILGYDLHMYNPFS